jgi:ABC-type Na+ efflux pump permease subunit
MAVLYLAVAYVHGWVMLFNGTLMTKHVSESFDDFSAFSWIVIHFFAAVVLIVYGLYFLYEIIGRQLKKPTLSKYCKPINWKQ